MGVPVLPPPQSRQTSYHPLDTEQDISTAASTIASAAGATSMGTASATVECDSLSRRAQMIILMDSRNAYVLLSRRAVCLFTMPHLLVYMLCLR